MHDWEVTVSQYHNQMAIYNIHLMFVQCMGAKTHDTNYKLPRTKLMDVCHWILEALLLLHMLLLS
jgi:hypothetical protein